MKRFINPKLSKTDFHKIFIAEGSPFYSDLAKIDSVVFNNWVCENFREYGKIDSFDEAIPSLSFINDAIQKGYKHIPSQCHNSARTICLLYDHLDYVTGFIYRPSDPLMPIITHSYNIQLGRIIDFARLNNDMRVIDEDENSYLPHVYYGVAIPKRFILSVKNLGPASMNPLLYEWISAKLIE
jgi:hypothetical protein